MSFIRKIKKSFQDEMGSSSRAGGPPSNNPFKQQQSANGPPPYAPMAPGGAAASYYGNAPQPQYPPVPVQNQYQQAPMMPPQHQMPPPQFQDQGPPNPLINPGTLPLPSMNPAPGSDDPYTFLRDFDTIILVDDSGSMSGGRWNQTAAALSTIVPIVTYYDSDGIDMYFLNAPDRPANHNIRTPAQVMEIFSTVRPQGSTPTGRALKRILDPYMEKYERSRGKCKPVNIIVITDGVPTDDVESHIVKYAKKLDRLDADLTQVGIQFFQIGSDKEATEALRELDDELGNMRDVRDMVDTAPWKGSLHGDQMLKVVLGAVNKRLDRKRI
ncbi:hypothetical protein H072_2466 [Dactylellina haptotyla CBS 200.50]|uniref:VWFA domain-containing protein n=1 Tax=Dactylellina haptotyla (strain CBS 200.50) TaxID=1284197 RepID=S8BVM9_DACHA|nr:hypothetical protein H072_2466 [Dactylellina haptotyla CBS 200.50]